MSISSITTNVISSLGNSSGSILPLFAKDAINSAGVAYVFSKKGGKHDGKEKAIEEFGTQGIWLLGIPAVKKLFDATVYKVLGYKPDVDIRKFQKGAADGIENTMERIGKTHPQYSILEHAKANAPKYKGLYAAKFAVATIATMSALHALISYKQKTTHQELKKEVYGQEFLNLKLSQAAHSFKGELKAAQNTAFKGGAGEFLSSFMYNPVRNMSILDGGIFAKRMQLSRKGEKGEVAFKEISTIGFLYVLAKPIQKGLEFLGGKITKLPLGLDYKVLADKEFKDYIVGGKGSELAESIENFYKNVNPNYKNMPKPKFSFKNAISNIVNKIKRIKVDDGFDNKAIVDYIYKNEDSPLVKMLKASGDVKTLSKKAEKLYGKKGLDPLAYIDTDNVKSTVSNLSSFMDKSDTISNALKKAKGAKVAAIFANIAIAAAFLAVVQPLLIIQARKNNNNGDSNNPAIRAEEEEIRSKFA